MLDQWLHWLPLIPNPYTKFAVIHVDHLEELQVEVRQYLQDLMIHSKIPETFLSRVNRRLKWDEGKMREQLIGRTIPNKTTAKRGEFGEILTCALLEHFSQFSIPVPKLWFKLTSGQSLPATDALAIKTDDTGNLIEICYVESKLRTVSDNAAAVQAAKQLSNDTSVSIPDILRFVALELDQKNSPLADVFVDYLADRSDTREKESYCIGLCWERAAWDDTVLLNLENDETHLERLSIPIVRIQNLGTLTDELFRAIGIHEVEDDD